MSRLTIVSLLSLAVLLVVGVPASAQQETVTYTGYIDSNVTSKTYSLPLIEGQAVLILMEATSGDLDTTITLFDPEGQIVASNDDRAADTYDSALGYIAPVSGDYSVTAGRWEDGDSSGSYELKITIGDESVLESLESMTRVSLSGDKLIRDTQHFRIHYTLTGVDATTEGYVSAMALTLEEVWRIQIDRMGWPAPPPDGFLGGDERFDVYVMDVLGSDISAMGYTSPESIIGDNPYTSDVESYASTSYFVVDNDFLNTDSGGKTAISLMRATVAHEFHHAIQFGYDINDLHDWYYEATATWMETKTLIKDEDATGYVAYTFQYPELCFGTASDPGDGQLMYGEWTFMQYLVDRFGDDAVLELWHNIGKYEGFEALQNFLIPRSSSIPEAVALYRIKNVARDYQLAPMFDATVWQEASIDGTGRWTYDGRGVQELGANYFALAPEEAGLYYAGLVNDDGLLQLWAVGVTADSVEAIPLGRGGSVDTSQFDYTYLMVFNPAYHDDVNDCRYSDYAIDISRSKENANIPVMEWSAQYFEPLG